MGVDFGDYDGDESMDLIKTNFSDDAPNVYHNNKDGTFADVTFEAGLGAVSRTSLGFGILFADLENSGRLDIVVANGHVNPQVDQQPMGIRYAERNFLFRNMGNGKFSEIGQRAGPGFGGIAVSRGLALADFDNDGFLDLVFTHLDGQPAVLHNTRVSDHDEANHWITIKLQGTRSNRDGYGAKVKVIQQTRHQIREVRSNFIKLVGQRFTGALRIRRRRPTRGPRNSLALGHCGYFSEHPGRSISASQRGRFFTRRALRTCLRYLCGPDHRPACLFPRVTAALFCS